MLEKYIQDVIKLSADTITKADKINQRLVTAVIVMAISFSISFAVTIIGISYFYFTSGYEYGFNQTQINTENSNQTIKGGN